MKKSSIVLRRDNPKALAEGLSRRLGIMRRVQSGSITREDGTRAIMALGDTQQEADYFFLHTLDQPRLDAERQRTGLIVN